MVFDYLMYLNNIDQLSSIDHDLLSGRNEAFAKYFILVNLIKGVLNWVYFMLWLREDTKETRNNMTKMLSVSCVLELATINPFCLLTAYFAY